MKRAILLFMILGLISCKSKQEKSKYEADTKFADNLELIEIYKSDQADRKTDNIDWSVVSKNDSLREIRIYELLDSNKVITSLDFHNAAMIFQHGLDTVASKMAVVLMKKSLELDPTENKWLLAAAIDRDLMRRNQAQIYGTQYVKMGKDAPWELYKIDTTKITDSERKEFNVETLAEQRKKVKEMNEK